MDIFDKVCIAGLAQDHQGEMCCLLSKRTLVRRLKQMCTSYQDILNNVRHELAIHYLATTSWSSEEIAHMLGYESASNFGRAFKKWTGTSPGEYRKKR